MRKLHLYIVIALLLCPAAACGSGEDAILGIWYDEERDAKIEIYRIQEKYYGRVVWTKEAIDAKTGKPIPRLDEKNPEPGLRHRPIIGLTIMRDFDYAGDNRWKGGRVYDPKTGKTYRGSMTLASPDRLKMRGFVAFSIFGRTTTWTRASE